MQLVGDFEGLCSVLYGFSNRCGTDCLLTSHECFHARVISEPIPVFGLVDHIL